MEYFIINSLMSLTAPLAYKLMHYFPNTNVVIPPGHQFSLMPKTLSPWSVCLSMNPEMCQEGLDWDTKGGFVEWGPFLVHFPWVPFLAYTKVLKMTSIHSCTDILTFLCPFIRILQSFPLLLSTLHTYVFFRNRVKTLRYFSLLFFSVRECRKISLSLYTGKSRRLSCQHILSVTLFLS